jgi:Basic region leucine zipper
MKKSSHPFGQTLRRLAQNREAARKSRLRKKVKFIFHFAYLFSDNECAVLCCSVWEIRNGLGCSTL